MKEIQCDVLVVGAGPSGSSAAWTAAKEGLDVVILDKKKIPGKDACAETLSKALLQHLPFKIPDKFLKWELNGLKFYYEDLNILKDNDILWKSHPLNRSEFDPFVLNMAINQGATYLPLTKFTRLKHKGNYHVDVVFTRNLKKKEILKIKPKILIAADGVQSQILRFIGKTKKQKNAIGYIKSYEYHNLSLTEPKYGHVFFGKFADGAYAYIFPKSETTANIGIATIGYQSIDRKFQEFLKIIKNQVKGSKIAVDRSGKAPLKNPSGEIFYGNILFTGDAANQNLKPFVEGIIPGIICGSLAGKSAAECIRNKKKLGNIYKTNINEKMGDMFLESEIIGSSLVKAYEKKKKERFLFELGIFSYGLRPRDIDKLEKLQGKKAEIYIMRKLQSNS
jgi:digeranylgeranylglycerophospholipid reductase